MINRVCILAGALVLASPAFAETDRYEAGELARAEFTLDERGREGGRSTPFFTSYRPNVSIEGAEPVICRFVTEAEGGHRPGTTGEIAMTCPVAVSAGQRFDAFERRRPIGSGVFLPRPEGDGSPPKE